MTTTVGIAIAVKDDTERLRLTLDSVFATPGRKPVEVVVVDDGSDDPVPVDIHPDALVYRTDGLGSAAAKNLALSALSTDVRIVMDAHMALPPFWAEMAASVPPDAVSCAACLPHWDGHESMSQGPSMGCILLLDPWGFYQSRWSRVKRVGVNPVQCLMGGFYYARAEAWQAVGGYAAGLQGWGYQQEWLSLRARAVGLRVLCDSSLIVYHDFRPTPERDKASFKRRPTACVANRATAMRALMGPELFERLWRPRLERSMSAPSLHAEIADGVARAENLSWTPEKHPAEVLAQIGMAIPWTNEQYTAMSRGIYSEAARFRSEPDVFELMRGQKGAA